jgi:ankyrin repeat protein
MRTRGRVLRKFVLLSMMGLLMVRFGTLFLRHGDSYHSEWLFGPAAGQGVQNRPLQNMPVKPILTPDTPLNARLYEAVGKGDLTAVRDLLAQGASADTTIGWPGQGAAPLALMASRDMEPDRSKYLPIFRLLVFHVANPNAADGNGRTLLMAAVDMDDLETVKQLVGRGADINAPMKRIFGGATALYFAAMQGGIRGKDPSPVTRFLLDHGARANVIDEYGGTPLIQAAQFGKIETVKQLLAHGADPMVRNRYGFTALRMASLRDHANVVRLLSAYSPMTLTEAAQFGNLERVRAGLDAGGNPNAPDAMGQTPLTAAMKSQSVEVVKLLLDRKADVNAADRRGWTALHYAASYGDARLAAVLLDRGADINALALPPTPLPPGALVNALAMQARPGGNGNASAAPAGPGVNNHPPAAPAGPGVTMAMPAAPARPTPTLTPLLCAVQQAQADMVDLLLRRGVDLKRHEQGALALEMAVRTAGQQPRRPREAPIPLPRGDAFLAQQDRIIEGLLKAGVNPRGHDSRALYLAAANGQAGLVELLLEKGAGVNGRNAVGMPGDMNEGQTALMGAIAAWGMAASEQKWLKAGSLSGPNIADLRANEATARKTVNLLLAKGADVNAADANGQTPLMLAQFEQLPDAAKLLLARHANLNAADHQGRTALMQAAAADDRPMVERLLARGADVNRRDKAGKTALMLAVDDGENDLYRQQRQREDDHLRNAHGENPPPIARKDLPNLEGHPEMLKLLLQHHADVNAVAQDGATALKLARRNDFQRAVALLQQAGAR